MTSKSICGKTLIRTSQSNTGDKKKSKAHRFWFFMMITGCGLRVSG
jgi:hypothetical protein